MAICHHTLFAIEKTQFRRKKKKGKGKGGGSARLSRNIKIQKQVMMKHFHSDNSTKNSGVLLMLRRGGVIKVHWCRNSSQGWCETFEGGPVTSNSPLLSSTPSTRPPPPPPPPPTKRVHTTRHTLMNGLSCCLVISELFTLICL